MRMVTMGRDYKKIITYGGLIKGTNMMAIKADRALMTRTGNTTVGRDFNRVELGWRWGCWCGLRDSNAQTSQCADWNPCNAVEVETCPQDAFPVHEPVWL